MLPLDHTALERVSRDEPDWLRRRRFAAYETFESLEIPSERDELWRYVDLDIDLGRFGVPDPASVTANGASRLLSSITDTSGRAVVVDGAVFAAEGGLVQVQRLVDAAAAAPDRMEALFGSTVPYEHDIFTAAHAAFGSDAVVVSVPRGKAAPGPILVSITSHHGGGATFPHLLIDVADGAEASIVVEYYSPHELDALVAPQIEAFTGSDSNLRLTIVQAWGYATTALAQAAVTVGRDSNVVIAEAGIGGDLSRLHLTVTLEGRGASAEVLGAYFGEKDQTLDYRYFMRHAGENTHSDMFLKGAVEDRALSVFTGLIRIDETAQRTDAFQTNRNLILSDGAGAQSVPNLEILANDVRCGHGSTVGPLDEEQRYYLMSRGLQRPQADRLQVRGFFEQVLQRFPEKSVTVPVREWIIDKFVSAQEEGRV